MFDFIFGLKKRRPPAVEQVTVGARQIPLMMVRHPRARRYLLRLRADGTARVTIPRGGSIGAAREFVLRSTSWLEQQLQQMESRPQKNHTWMVGSEILFRGESARLETGEPGWIRFSGETLKANPETNLRPLIEWHLRQLATAELPPRLLALAARHGLTVRRVTVRNQRTRWGSCSRRGTISLNWRLIQTPAFVQDYIFLHELAHLLEMNHSERFWQQVERLCPDYRTAERWLKQNRSLLG